MSEVFSRFCLPPSLLSHPHFWSDSFSLSCHPTSSTDPAGLLKLLLGVMRIQSLLQAALGACRHLDPHACIEA